MLRSFLFFLLFLSFSTPGLAAPLRVLFDQGHAQFFTIDKEGDLHLGQLAERFRRNGWQVDATTDPITPRSLADADALIVSGAFQPFSPIEVEAIAGFLENGGRLAVMLHIAPPLSSLLERLGVAYPQGVVREGDPALVIAGDPLSFKTTGLKDHPLTKDLAYFSVYGAWPLIAQSERVHVIAATSPKAWVDLDRDQRPSPGDPVREYAILVAGRVGRGEFAVFADDAIFQNRFLQGENEKLADNLVSWMGRGRTVEHRKME